MASPFEGSSCNDGGGASVRRHREVLAVACVVCTLAFAMTVRPDGRVAVRGFPQYPLPPSCASRSLLGLKCPGCGLTRALIHAAEGDWRASWRDHRLGGLLAAVIALQIPYRLLALRRPDRPVIAPRWQALLGYALIVLLIGNWLVDVVAGQVISTEPSRPARENLGSFLANRDSLRGPRISTRPRRSGARSPRRSSARRPKVRRPGKRWMSIPIGKSGFSRSLLGLTPRSAARASYRSPCRRYRAREEPRGQPSRTPSPRNRGSAE